ncbi:MAG: polysaccharide deacetylase family protein [Chitinophagaceae bacterium]
MIVRNFLFHRVAEEKDMLWPPMHPGLFEKTIRLLMTRFNVVLLEDFLEDPGAQQSKKQTATVSFDDGYKDNLEIAAPILSKYKCPASFYVVSDCINRQLPTWTYITDFFFQREKASLSLDNDFVPASFRKIEWNALAEGSEWGKKIKPWMKSLSNPLRLWVMEQLQAQNRDASVPGGMMMNWEEVKQLKQAGFYIGSHSHTHPMLASLEKETEIKEELAVSAEQIAFHLGHRPVTISYPIGSWDQRVVMAATETGYHYGLAVEQRFYNTAKDGVLTIPRTELYNEPWWKTQARISGLYQKIRKLMR